MCLDEDVTLAAHSHESILGTEILSSLALVVDVGCLPTAHFASPVDFLEVFFSDFGILFILLPARIGDWL